ncbi:MAG TPA: ABC transporter substrate-binding protein [Candidatus Acidoferrales bacterium]|nr:ABC transporter substrate-binding protein [Candidatus Acidoferrales bacterium]
MSNASRAKRPILAVVVVVIIVLAGVGVYYITRPSTPAPSVLTSTYTSASSVSLPTTLILDDSYVPSTMDPAAPIENEGLQLGQEVDLPLVFCANAACTNLVPVLATSWTASSDGLTYTFLLRNGVYYSNGDPFNAYVVWYNVYRDLIINQAGDFIFYEYFNSTGVTAGDLNSLDNSQNTPNSTLLQIMINPHNCVTVVNATAVQFHLTNPFAAFMETIETDPWVFIDPYFIGQNGGVVTGQPNSWMSVNGNLVGDGPYIAQTYVTNEYIILIANPHYWAENLTGSQTNFYIEPAKIPRVVVNYKTDELTRALDLEKGYSQASIISFDDLQKVKAACPTCYIPNIGLSGSVEWVMIDSLRAPLDNVLVRRAIIAAINMTQIRQITWSGYITPLIGPEPTTLAYYNNSIAPPEFNVTLAKQLLVEAGYPNGQGLPPIDFYYEADTYLASMGQLMKQDLAVIGIDLELKGVTGTTIATLFGIPGANSTAPDMMATNWTYYPDFSGYECIVDSAFGCIGNMHNETIYNLILQSNTELNPTIRAHEISQITQDVLQSAAIIWLGQDIDVYDTGAGVGPVLFNSCVSGAYYNMAFNGLPFNTLYYTCTP